MDPLTLFLISTAIAAAGVGAAAHEADKAGKGTKEAARRSDLASQSQQFIEDATPILAQLVPGSEEFNQGLTIFLDMARSISHGGPATDRTGAFANISTLVRQQQERVAKGGPATSFEARTDLAFEALRKVSAFSPEEQDVFDALRDRNPQLDTAIGDVFGQVVERARDPDRFFESTLQPQLDLARDIIGQGFARRGLVGSGLQLEQLGRTGAELAIREAQARESFRQEQLGQAQNLFNVSQGLRGREIGLERERTGQQFSREQFLEEMLSGRTERAVTDRVQFGRGEQTFQRTLEQQARAFEEQKRQEAMDAAMGLGQTIASGFSGANLPTGSAGTFAPLSGGPPAPISIDELLALQRSGLGGLTQPRGQSNVSSLSRLAKF